MAGAERPARLIGNVLRRAADVLRARPRAIIGVSFVVGALPNWLVYFDPAAERQTSIAQPASAAPASDALLGLDAVALAIVVGVIVAAVLLALAAQGTVFELVVREADGDPTTVRAALRSGLRGALPLLGLGITIGLCCMFGLSLLLVPGLVIYITWCVASPALVIERRGVVAALGRSQTLTKGARWQVFALQLLMLAVYWIVSVGLDLNFATSLGPADGTSAGSGFSAAFGWVGTTVVLMLWAVLQASLYVELRNWKEGPVQHHLAEIFA